jgi:hypothetical protein
VVPVVEGLGGEPIEEHAFAGLTVALSRPASRPQPTTEAAVRHGAVVEVLARANDAVLPARFGTWFGTTEGLAREVSARAGALREALEHVRGCAELGVRISATGRREPAPAVRTGTEYLRARLAATTEAERVAKLVDERLRPLARAAARRPSGDLIFNGAYLVERARVEAFREAASELESRHRFEVAVTGPWPPYSFSALPEDGR